VYSVALRLPAPGVWRVRAVVSDGVSDRLGTAVQTIEVPVRSALAMSGVSLRVYDPGGMNAATDPQESEAERIFRRGHRLQVSYAIFNPLVNENKEAQVEVSTRLYARGQLVFSGGPSLLTYPVEPGVHRMVTSWLALAPSSTPGDYLLEVTLADKSGPPGPPRSVSRFIDFQVRE
jgi:hypothetical protein